MNSTSRLFPLLSLLLLVTHTFSLPEVMNVKANPLNPNQTFFYGTELSTLSIATFQVIFRFPTKVGNVSTGAIVINSPVVDCSTNSTAPLGTQLICNIPITRFQAACDGLEMIFSPSINIYVRFPYFETPATQERDYITFRSYGVIKNPFVYSSKNDTIVKIVNYIEGIGNELQTFVIHIEIPFKDLDIRLYNVESYPSMYFASVLSQSSTIQNVISNGAQGIIHGYGVKNTTSIILFNDSIKKDIGLGIVTSFEKFTNVKPYGNGNQTSIYGTKLGGDYNAKFSYGYSGTFTELTKPCVADKSVSPQTHLICDIPFAPMLANDAGVSFVGLDPAFGTFKLPFISNTVFNKGSISVTGFGFDDATLVMPTGTNKSFSFTNGAPNELQTIVFGCDVPFSSSLQLVAKAGGKSNLIESFVVPRTIDRILITDNTNALVSGYGFLNNSTISLFNAKNEQIGKDIQPVFSDASGVQSFVFKISQDTSDQLKMVTISTLGSQSSIEAPVNSSSTTITFSLLLILISSNQSPQSGSVSRSLVKAALTLCAVFFVPEMLLLGGVELNVNQHLSAVAWVIFFLLIVIPADIFYKNARHFILKSIGEIFLTPILSVSFSSESVVATFNALLQAATESDATREVVEAIEHMVDMIRVEIDYIVQLFRLPPTSRPNVAAHAAREPVVHRIVVKPPAIQRPSTLPYDDTDAFYVRVLIYNLHMITKLARARPSTLLIDRLTTLLLQTYTSASQEQSLASVLPTTITCIASLIPVAPFPADTISSIISSEVRGDRPAIDAALHLLKASLDRSSRTTFPIPKELFRRLSSLVYAKRRSIQLALPRLFQSLLTPTSLDTSQIRKIITTALFKLSDTDPQVKSLYLELLPKTVVYMDSSSQRNLNAKAGDISLPYKQLLMRSAGPYPSFPTFFKTIFEWLYGRWNDNASRLILEQFYDSNVLAVLLKENAGIDIRKIETIVSTSDELIWYWAMWECARFCITNRLKTPFGTGVQTFEIFERIILQFNKERKDFKKIRIMLQFMDSLEKQIFSAAYGSVILPPPSSKEILFFKLNGRVSEDWFSRIRMNLLKASILCSSAPDIIRHASLRITDIRANRFVDPAHAHLEMEFCVLHLANALQQLNEAETLQGVSKWLDTNGRLNGLAVSTPWMTGIIQSTNHRYEDAIQSLTSLLPSTDPSSISFLFVVEHVVKAYLELSDFSELDSFMTKFRSLNQANVKLAYKDSYLRALSALARSDLDSASKLINECRSDSSAGTREANGLLGNSLATDELILAAKIEQRQSPNGIASPAIFEAAKHLVHDSLAVLGHESNVQTFHHIVQLKLLDELEHGVHDTRVPPRDASQLGFLERLRSMRNHLAATQHRTDLLFLNIPLTESLIKLSRKTANPRFCSRLLNSVLESHSPSYFLEKSKLKYMQDKKLEAFTDLLKYSSQFPDTVTPAIKTKTYLQIVKILADATKSNPQLHHYVASMPAEQVDAEYYFKKAAAITPEHERMWLGYGDWAIEQAELSKDDTKTRMYRTALECYFEHLRWNQDGSTIQTTLKIFDILVNHGPAHAETFERCFAKLPSAKPFMDTIPQLFARLGHPDKATSAAVAHIITRIGEEAPHRIAFPTLVALAQGDAHPNAPQIATVHSALVAHAPVLVEETATLIRGLDAITILWDDSWQQLMEQCQAWLYGHMKVWTDEYNLLKKSKVSNINSRLKRKNLALLQPILDKINRLLLATILGVCATPHEKWFASLHYEIINKVIRYVEKQTKPSMPFAALQELIQHFSSTRLTSLELSSIQPTLHAFRPTSLRMPGLDTTVTIQAIQPTIFLLPSKTKPKKLAFVGSDGVSYSYLLKGREDLHLDERIMQLLNIIDQMLAAATTSERRASLGTLRTRNYAVVPLSRSSGLIQWVESAVPMFSIYKNWISVRPVDIFHSKLTPLLNERNISKVNRNEWPRDLLVQVHLEMTNETPKWLLSRELWYSSCSTSELFLKTQSFARSLALMSMIGYLIGLGDRHLDNILIDLKTGEIVHIDYNICFEKGLQLHVPERVPFRMTQIIEHALGLSGVHGTFTETCKHVLGLLRKNKQTIFNILETFIYDPLFDWKLNRQTAVKENNGDAGEPNEDDKPIIATTNGKDEEFDGGNNEHSDNDSSSEEDTSIDTIQTDMENLHGEDEEQAKQQQQEIVPPPPPAKTDNKSLQGLSIINQVRMKLESDHKSVDEQVDMIIKQAISIDNLSVMYEGWTPWI
eukprot:gene7489-8762_t